MRGFRDEVADSFLCRYGGMRMANERTSPTPIGRRLRELRGGLTQAQAAERAGITKAAWQLIETGKTQNPSSRTLKGIAKAFGVSFDSLYAYVDRLPSVERFTDEELDRLAVRLAPFVADRIIEFLERH